MKTKPNNIYRLNSIIALLVLLLSSCSQDPSETPTTVPPTMTTVALPTNTDFPEPTTLPSPSPQPTSEPIPVTASAEDTAAALLAAEHPPVDYFRLAQQLQGITPDELTPEAAAAPVVGLSPAFIVNTDLEGDYGPVPARLRYQSENVAWWSTVKVDLSDEEIEAIAELFEAEMLPINRLLFGKEWSPGIDNDPLIHILFVDGLPWPSSYFGYFSKFNEYPTAIFPHSNQREMIVVNASYASVDLLRFVGKLGHEYQHLIHWNNDPNEDQWLNEAMSELSNFLSGAPPPPPSSMLGYTNLELFALNPDIQLTSRPEKRFGDFDKAAFMHYGAERLFAVYLFEQFGAQFIKVLAENPAPGVIAVQQELDKLPGKPRFQEVYAAWILANLLNQPNLMEGQYGYQDIKPYLPEPELVRTFEGEPIQDQLPPYGTRYYEIRSGEDLSVAFNGSTLARLTPLDPASGEYAWYSNRGDESEFSLTRAFDLSKADSATLNYKVWYELDEFYDYAYVEVSTDGGESWTILGTAHGTDQNPYELAYGHGYTGTALEWQGESLDLSPYTGQVIQLRFELILDWSANRDGLQLDDIEIPEIGFFDGAEDESGGWEARGFVRSSNFVPAEWIVWLLKLGVGLPTQVERIEMGTDQSAEFEISGFGEEFSFAAVVVSPTAPVTTMELDYELLFEHR